MVDSLADRFDVLVVDDGSTDGTSWALKQRESIALVTHAQNMGYAASLLRLFEQCRSEYLLVAADDDTAIPEEIERLARWLDESKPDFMSTQWRRKDGTFARGQDSLRPISTGEIHNSASHAPGLVYRTAAVREILPAVAEFVAEQEESALVYPQVLTVLALASRSTDIWWWPGAPIVAGGGLPSGIRSTTGQPYFSSTARVAQSLSFLRFLERIEGNDALRQLYAHRLLERSFGLLATRTRLEVTQIAAEQFMSSSLRVAWRLLLGATVRRALRRPC